jgi:predicted DNA-binding ribbon-helix-helix protein
MNNSEEEIKLQLRPRTAEIVSLNIPTDTLASLEKIAANRDMSVQALLTAVPAVKRYSSNT